jgi:hypothetical protein
VLLVVLGLIVLAACAHAAGSAADSSSVGRGKGFDRPFWVMMRSAAVPGWGQAKNGQWVKAVLLGGAEVGLYGAAVREDRLAGDARRNARLRPDESWYWLSRAEAHKSRKKDYVWWGSFALLLSLGDAYVDAHLKGFDAEFKTQDSAMMLSVGVRW